MAMTNDPDAMGIGDTGYTIDDLSAYLDRGRTPAIAAIDTNAECQALLASMERVGAFGRELLAHDVAAQPAVDEGRIAALLATIGQEVRAGRDIPLTSPDPRATLSVTEGAVRELVRAAGDSVDGVVVGSCSLDGDVMAVGSPVRVALTISVVLNGPVRELAETVRQRVFTAVLAHTELSVEGIDVTVTDVHQPRRRLDEGSAS